MRRGSQRARVGGLVVICASEYLKCQANVYPLVPKYSDNF